MKTNYYTLWHGHLPLIDYLGKYRHDVRGRYRLATYGMKGLSPSRFESREEAIRVAEIYAIGGVPLEVVFEPKTEN
jgi:hypothetical protein